MFFHSRRLSLRRRGLWLRSQKDASLHTGCFGVGCYGAGPLPCHEQFFTRHLCKITERTEKAHARVYERSGKIPMNPLRTITASYPTNKTYSFHVEHVMSVSVATDVDAWDDPSCNVEALLQIRAAVGASAAVGIRVPRHGGGI